MAVVKKKKKRRGATGGFGGGTGQEHSPLRPRRVEKTAPCIDTCPSGTDIRGFVTAISQTEYFERTNDESFQKAWEIITDRNPFPAVCGRVCPHPCEEQCNRKEKEGAVGINALERYVGDFGIQKGLKLKKLDSDSKDKKVAVIGAGPAGLSCAYQLARQGYPVTVFEAFAKTGGMLRYGIPSYRLPREIIDAEVNKILDLGVELKTNTSVGNDISIEDLKKEYQAIFIGIGAHKGMQLRAPGEDASNVFSGVGFLNKINSGEKVDVGKKVIVVGGGDTAIDAARACKRLGADVIILYRRTLKEMPAIDEEIEEAQHEGIDIQYLAAPVKLLKEGDVAPKMECIRMELGEPDSSGRRRPVPKDGSEFVVDMDTVIAAISQEPDFTGFEDYREGRDWIKADEHGAVLEKEGIFSGGDVLDLATVTNAIGQGRRAAETIIYYLKGEEIPAAQPKPPVIFKDKMRIDHFEESSRNERDKIPLEDRFKDFDAEVGLGLNEEQAIAEAKRCMSCGLCFWCDKCFMFCSDSAVVKPSAKGEFYTYLDDKCTGCKKCAEECPCGFIDMV